MSSRARGDHGTPYTRPWHARRSDTYLLRRAGGESEADGARDPVPASPDRPVAGGRRPKSRAARRAIIAILVLTMGGAAYASDRTAHPPPRVYPPTPRAWLAAYLSAGVENPSRVCRVLFAPELSARYRHRGPRSCAPSLSTVKDRRVRIRRIVQTNAAAVIELRQTHPADAWVVVLARHGSGWQAVELFSGRRGRQPPARAHHWLKHTPGAKPSSSLRGSSSGDDDPIIRCYLSGARRRLLLTARSGTAGDCAPTATERKQDRARETSASIRARARSLLAPARPHARFPRIPRPGRRESEGHVGTRKRPWPGHVLTLSSGAEPDALVLLAGLGLASEPHTAERWFERLSDPGGSGVSI
jgi:hypothetical protein